MISIAGTGGGKGTFDAVMHGLRLLQRHNVEYNVLACVGRETAKHPLEIYRFLRDEGVEFIQFTPVRGEETGCIEHNGDVYACDHCVYPPGSSWAIFSPIHCPT